MGCDIHDYVEVYENGHWRKLGKVFIDRFEKEYNKKEVLSEHPYDNRNYALFGLLAGVRNQTIPSIMVPRGVPEDASDEYLKIVEDYGCDGHSHSHFTLQELLDYPLYKFEFEREGVVSSEEYKRFKKEGSPNGWSGGAFGTNIFHISNEQMDEYLENPNQFLKDNIEELLVIKSREYRSMPNCPAHLHFLQMFKEYVDLQIIPDASFFTKINWSDSIADAIGQHWFDTMEEMKKHAPEGDYNRIRMVFFFDN